MTEPYLTKAEIGARYPNEWVFVANPKHARGYRVLGGHVIIHSADRTEFYRLLGEWVDPTVTQTASWYTGKVGEWLGETLSPDAESGAA